MYRDKYQNGFFTIFNSHGANPLSTWKPKICDGHCKRLTDSDINSLVLELLSTNSTTTFICSPNESHQSLAIKLPFINFIVKNVQKYFGFEIQIKDDQNQLRRYQASNFQSKTKINTFSVQMPLILSDGWNRLQINLDDFTRRAFSTNYIETVCVRVNANCRLRRIYFTDRLYHEHEIPLEYHAGNSRTKNDANNSNENIQVPPTSPQAIKEDDCCKQFDCHMKCAK